MQRVDLDLACAGYLRSPDGRHVRFLVGLDLLASDTVRLGADVYWRELPGHQAGSCAWWCGRISLAPWLFWAWPWFVRSVWSHELGHVAVGPSQERARTWQTRSYGDLLLPGASQLV